MAKDRRKWLLALAALVAALVSPIRSVLAAFGLALFLAGCLQPALRRWEARHLPRWCTMAALLALGLAPLLLGCWWGSVCLLRWIQSAVEQLQVFLLPGGAVEDWLYRLKTALPPLLQDGCEQVLSALEQRQETLLAQLMAKLAGLISALLTALPTHLAGLGLFLLCLCFCAVDYPALAALARKLLPPDWAAKLQKAERCTRRQLKCWCIAQCKLSGLILLELSLGLAALRMQGWAAAAVVITLIDLVPLVGSGLVLLPWCGLLLLQGHKLTALGLGLLWLCVWATRTLLEPKLVGRQLQLPAALSLLSAILGAKLWGLRGLILFPVLASVLVSLLR
jgi:predicted PurR-regulated permease PerM